MSHTAYQSLTEGQIGQLSKYAKIMQVDVQTIEKHGGGGARCMIA